MAVLIPGGPSGGGSDSGAEYIWRSLYSGTDSEGRVFRSFNVLGRREGFSSTDQLEDIAQLLTTPVLPVPDGTQSWEVVSDSGNDTAAGTGVQSVLIHYLNDSWLYSTVTVDMDGTTPVAIPEMANCRAINWMHTVTVGSNGVAVGTIDLRLSGGGTVFEEIVAGGNQSLTCHYTVPDGYFAVVQNWQASVATNHRQDIRLRATSAKGSGEWVEGFLFQDVIALDNNVAVMPGISKVYGPRTDIKISTITQHANAEVSASFTVYLLEI